VANWTAAKVWANMQDQYHTHGSCQSRGADHGKAKIVTMIMIVDETVGVDMTALA